MPSTVAAAIVVPLSSSAIGIAAESAVGSGAASSTYDGSAAEENRDGRRHTGAVVVVTALEETVHDEKLPEEWAADATLKQFNLNNFLNRKKCLKMSFNEKKEENSVFKMKEHCRFSMSKINFSSALKLHEGQQNKTKKVVK